MTWFASRIVYDLWEIPFVEGKPLVLVLTFLMTLALAAPTYRWLENPILRLKDRWFALKPN